MTPNQLLTLAQARTRSRRQHGGFGSLGESDAVAIGRAIGQAAVQDVTFRTQITPDVAINPFAPGAPTANQSPTMDWFLRYVMKPSVRVTTPAGVFEEAPWGRPTGNFFPILAAGAVLGGVLLVGVVYRGLTK